MNSLERYQHEGDLMCMSLWGVSMEEVSNIRMSAFYESPLRYTAIHGRGNYSMYADESRKPHSGDPGYLTGSVWKMLTKFGVVQKGGRDTKGIIDLDKLDWCCSHPCVTTCVDPG